MQPPPPPAEKSPSPPPQPPLAATPGPLAQRAREIYMKALTTTIQTCSYSAFAACFPTPAAQKPEVLKSAWKQFVDKCQERGQWEWGEIERERGVVEGFNGLEGVLAEARGRMNKSKTQPPPSGDQQPQPQPPPHTLPPSILYQAHLITPLTPIHTTLSSYLTASQTENAQLYDEILAQRREIEKLVEEVEARVGDLKEAGAVLGGAVEEGTLKGVLGEGEGMDG
ncbi:MAG: hypothetical protein MMC33_004548 [Icmadophila ericetorum]|nr:hypothetical protein [Icmadophila ericetorum]